jgi:hypothetical protein
VSTKTVVLLAIVIVIFVVVLIVGNAKSDDRKSTDQPWWSGVMDRVTSALMPRHVVTARDALGKCVDGSGVVVPLGSTCKFAIRSASVTVRELQMHLAGGQRANVVVELKGDVAMKVTFPLRTEFATSPKVKVLKGGADVTITCNVSIDPTLTCRFQFLQ